MNKYLLDKKLLICIPIILMMTLRVSFAQTLPISDDFSLCATVDSRTQEVQLGWQWTGADGQASGYSIYPETGQFIPINNPAQQEATFSLEANQVKRFYVLRQGIDGQVFRSNDVSVRLRKTRVLEFLVPGLHQSKNKSLVASNCPGYEMQRQFGISKPLLGAFGVSVLAWGAVLIAKDNNRKARSNFLFEEDTRYTAEAYEKWQDTFEQQRLFRDIAVITTFTTYAVHLISILQSKDKGLQPEIFDLTGQRTQVQFSMLERKPALSFSMQF